ncbi:MAG: hypothetical protein ABH950_09715 [Candidatus Altiarchaeota archaeon]
MGSLRKKRPNTEKNRPAVNGPLEGPQGPIPTVEVKASINEKWGPMTSVDLKTLILNSPKESTPPLMNLPGVYEVGEDQRVLLMEGRLETNSADVIVFSPDNVDGSWGVNADRITRYNKTMEWDPSYVGAPINEVGGLRAVSKKVFLTGKPEREFVDEVAEKQNFISNVVDAVMRDMGKNGQGIVAFQPLYSDTDGELKKSDILRLMVEAMEKGLRDHKHVKQATIVFPDRDALMLGKRVAEGVFKKPKN